MAITTLDQLLAGLQPSLPFIKATASCTAGTWQTLWYVAGRPAAGSGPASLASATLDSTTTGALSFTNPSSGRLSYLARLFASSAQIGTLMVYDRLAHYGFANATAPPYVMSSPVSAPSARGGVGELWLEAPTAYTSGAATVAVSYTNQAGTTGRTVTAAAPGTCTANAMFPLLLQSGDTGAKSVASVTVGSANLAGSGTSNIVILRRLAEIPVGTANLGNTLDALALGFQQVYDSSCLAFAWLPGAATTGVIQGSLALAQG